MADRSQCIVLLSPLYNDKELLNYIDYIVNVVYNDYIVNVV